MALPVLHRAAQREETNRVHWARELRLLPHQGQSVLVVKRASKHST